VASLVVSIIALAISGAAIGVSLYGHRSRNSLTLKQIEIQSDVRDLQTELAQLQRRKFEREEAEAAAAAGAKFEASLSAFTRGEVTLRIHNTGKAAAESLEVTFWSTSSTVMTGEFDPSNHIEILPPGGASEIGFEHGQRLELPVTVAIAWREGSKSREAKATFHRLGPDHVKFH
jgi:hypothetical protein